MHPLLQTYFKCIKRFLSDGKTAGVIGIDLSSNYFRAVEISARGDAFELSNLTSVPIEASDEKAALTKVLASFAKTDKPRIVVVSASGKGTLIRYIDMPRMSFKDLKKAFAIESDKYFPFPKDTIYTDCHILDPKSADKKMSVLVAAVKKDVVDARIKLLREVGIDPMAVTLSAAAVSNAFTAIPPAMLAQTVRTKGAGTVALVDIGESSTNLMIISAGVPRFSRDIFIGITEIVKRITNVAGVSAVEAGAFLYKTEERPEAAQKALEAIVSSLVSEIRLSFDYFITEKNMPIGQLYLIGEGVVIPGIEEIFVQSMDIPLVVWNPLEKLILAPRIDRGTVEKEGRRFITALGLALNEYDQA
jgi:type IV pilus assembly protein PilM